MSSGGGGTSTQTTTQELSPEQRELIKPVIPIATDYLKNPPQMFPGTGIAGFNPLQQAAQGMTMNAVQGMIPSMNVIPQQLQALMGGWGGNVNAAGQQGAQGQNQLNAILAAMGQQSQGVTGLMGQQAGNIAGGAANTAGQIAGQNAALEGNLMNSFGNTMGLAGQTAGQVQQGIQQGNAAMAPGLGFLTGGAALSPDTNPFLQQAIAAASRPTIENFQNVVMPGIAGEAVSAGGFGGSRQGIAEGLAAQGMQRTVGDISANMGNAGYAQGLGAMTQGLGIQQQQQVANLQAMIQSGQLSQGAAQSVMQGILGGAQTQQAGTLGAGSLSNQAANQIMQSILSGGQFQQDALGKMITGNLGGQQAAQGWSQQQQAGLGSMGGLLGNTGNILQQGLLPAQLTEAVGTQQQAMEQARLSEQVQRFVNQQMMPFAMAQDVASMAFGMPGGTTKTTATGSSAGQGMGLAQSGLGAIAALPALFGKSDRKLKENIKKIGKLADGLFVYSFKLKDELIERIGLMADEVMQLYPIAVNDNGSYMTVRYDLVPSWNSRNSYRKGH